MKFRAVCPTRGPTQLIVLERCANWGSISGMQAATIRLAEFTVIEPMNVCQLIVRFLAISVRISCQRRPWVTVYRQLEQCAEFNFVNRQSNN